VSISDCCRGQPRPSAIVTVTTISTVKPDFSEGGPLGSVDEAVEFRSSRPWQVVFGSSIERSRPKLPC